MRNKKLNILVVEDEVIASEYLLNILESLNFKNTFSATSMSEALEIVKNNLIDLVFMDINISGSTDGIKCAKVLNEHYFLPIIFTTAYGDSQSILEASDTNIFGYIIKPFEKNDIEAALSIALKRIKPLIKNNKTIINLENIVEFGNSQKYNLLTQTFYINNIPINLTKKETDILHILCKNLNQNISYETLKEEIWNNKDISNSTIRDTISRLKKKANDLNIETIINYGYILKISR